MSRKDLTITLHVSEMVYDVQNKSFLTGRSRQVDSNFEQVAHMQANDDEENSNQIARSIGNAFNALKMKMGEYVVETGTTANNTLLNISKDSKLTLTLSMPSNYNEATRESIASSVHQYITNTALGEWFTITNKADAADYIAQAAIDLSFIREAINKRVRPARPQVN